MHLSMRLILIPVLIVVIRLIPPTYQQQSKNVRIGALFEDSADPLNEIVFKHAVQRINSDHKILPNSNLNVRIEKVAAGNSLDLSEKVCTLMRQGIAAIFGPGNTEGASLTESICDVFDIPHIETKWDFQASNKHKINLHPHPHSLSLAYKQIVETWQWKNYVILYDDNYGLTRLDELLKSGSPIDRQVIIRQLRASPEGSQDYRQILREIMAEEDFKHIVLDCTAAKAQVILKQAQQVGMMYYHYSYLLTTLDIETMDLEDFKYGGINITAFRLVDPNRPEVRTVINELNSMMIGTTTQNPYGGYGGQYSMPMKQQPYFPAGSGSGSGNTYGYGLTSSGFNGLNSSSWSQSSMTTEVALMYDAVQLLGETLHVLDNIQKIDIRPLNCERSEQWRFGSSIVNYMHLAQFQGLTGSIKFDTEGYRTSVSLDVVQVTEEGIRKVGFWNTNQPDTFNFDLVRKAEASRHAALAQHSEECKDLHKCTLRVTTFLIPPFCMLKRDHEVLQDNEQYEGFIVDLVDKLSHDLKFKYLIQIVADNAYGSYNKTSDTWNGMIGEILENAADIVVADLAINKIRQTAVDFTMPFMNLGISILYTTPKAKPPGLFSFMSPFSFSVWVCVAIALFGVPLVHFVIGRISPQEWDNPFNCVQNPKDITIRTAISTRMLAGTWWFFTLIMVSSYTASLATFLIVQDLDESIKSLDDLVSQTKVKYGCVGGASTAAFFKDSSMEEKRKVWDNMVKMQSTKNNNDEGIKAVKEANGGYAFFMESTLIEYNVERVCGLAQVGGLLDNKGYGIALRKNSSYLGQLSSGILQLQERGVLSDLKRKWWKEERKEPTCAVASAGDNVEALRLINLGGVFVVLVVGCAVATVVAFCELFMKTGQVPLEENESRWQMIKDELRFALTCQGNVKPVKKKLSVSVGGPSAGEMGSGNFLDLGITNPYGFPKMSPTGSPITTELADFNRVNY